MNAQSKANKERADNQSLYVRINGFGDMVLDGFTSGRKPPTNSLQMEAEAEL